MQLRKVILGAGGEGESISLLQEELNSIGAEIILKITHF